MEGGTPLSVEPMHLDEDCPRLVDEESLSGRFTAYGNEAHQPTTPSTSSYTMAHYRTILTASLKQFWIKVKSQTLSELLWISLLMLLVTVGNFLQIIMLNFWLVSFPADGNPGNYTAFAIPGILFTIFFVAVLIVYLIMKRPDLRFCRHWYGWVILIGVGFCDTFNSWLATYAASYTSEVLQALFTNFSPLYTVFMAKWILSDPRRYLNVWIVLVFVLTIGGILAASLYGLIEDTKVDEGKIAWIFIFFISIPFRVLQNVLQSLYMIIYTYDPSFLVWLQAHQASEVKTSHRTGDSPAAESDEITERSNSAPPFLDREQPNGCAPDAAGVELSTEPSASIEMLKGPEIALTTPSVPWAPTTNLEAYQQLHQVDLDCEESPGSPTPVEVAPVMTSKVLQGEDTIVKLMMLVGDTFFQTCFTMALLPADAIPWWGYSESVHDTWDNFVEGVHCVFTIRKNFIFGFLYTLGFIFTYVGCAYLNHYSVALCSIVTQLSSPLTALILVLVPQWNVMSGGDSPWYLSLVAIICLSVAALLYVTWEDMTEDEKMEGEQMLKKRKLGITNKLTNGSKSSK